MNVARLGAGVVSVVILVSLAACGPSDGSVTASSGSPGGAAAATVEHAYGTTELDEVPERVVALDLQWADVLLAMGVEPVGYGADPTMPDDGPPWWEQGMDAGKALSLDDGLPMEQIAALEPDLVVGTYSIPDQRSYERLSKIAPTVAGSRGESVERWPDLVTTAGKLLDRQDRAEQVVDSVESTVDGAAEDLPQLEGKTFALAQYIVGDAMYVVADKGDGSSQLFQQLGMRMLPAVAKEGEKTGSARVEVSTERVDLLESDFLAFLVNGGDESDLADVPGFDELPASRSGAAAVLDYATIVGLNTPSPLSVPHVLDQLRPYLKRVE